MFSNAEDADGRFSENPCYFRRQSAGVLGRQTRNVEPVSARLPRYTQFSDPGVEDELCVRLCLGEQNMRCRKGGVPAEIDLMSRGKPAQIPRPIGAGFDERRLSQVVLLCNRQHQFIR